MCVCVCCDIYIYVCVCEVKIFLPFKRRDDVEQTKHKHVSVRFEKREKKNRIKKAQRIFSSNPIQFYTFLFLITLFILLRGISLSLRRVYSKERVGEKGEDKRV